MPLEQKLRSVQNKFSQISKTGKEVFNTQCLMIKNIGTAPCLINSVWPLPPGDTYISNLPSGLLDNTEYTFVFDTTANGQPVAPLLAVVYTDYNYF